MPIDTAQNVRGDLSDIVVHAVWFWRYFLDFTKKELCKNLEP